MAAKATAKPSTTAMVKNPAGGRTQFVTSGKDKGKGKGKTTGKKNPETANIVKSKGKTYKRNPSETTSGILFAVGGALVINGLDELINRFAPAISNPIRIGGKVTAGWAIGRWGKKYIGSWAGIAQNALWLAAAMDAMEVYVKPLFSGFFTTSAPKVVGTDQIRNTDTGQLGMRIYLSDGNQADFWDETGMNYAPGMQPAY